MYCENHTVNAAVTHYLAGAMREGISANVRLCIPEKAGHMSEMDLCIIMGNLLENAVEACRRTEVGERFIRARFGVEGGHLSMIVENSFDGVWREHDGVYLFHKHEGKGIGLSSVRALTEKYGGLAEFRVKGNTFSSSVLVTINGSVNQEQHNRALEG